MVRLFDNTITSCFAAVSTITAFLFLVAASAAANAAELYITVVARTQSPPIGWVQFCQTYEGVCNTKPLPPLDVVLDDKAWNALKRVNDWVNHSLKPMTDMDHYGMIQWWRYPDDGTGACHSYALLKRRLLMQAGWPRQSLLMTIVHESDGEGHAVLMVETDRGEFILDNLTDEIFLWSETQYRYYKRQSRDDPNTWVWLDDTRSNDAALERKIGQQQVELNFFQQALRQVREQRLRGGVPGETASTKSSK